MKDIKDKIRNLQELHALPAGWLPPAVFASLRLMVKKSISLRRARVLFCIEMGAGIGYCVGFSADSVFLCLIRI